MSKKVNVFALLLLLTFCLPAVHADISSDMAEGISISQVLENALDSGLSVEQAIVEMVAISPDSAGIIVSAAIAVQPESHVSISQTAISVGVDPGTVTNASAMWPSFFSMAFVLPVAPPVGGGGGVSAN